MKTIIQTLKQLEGLKKMLQKRVDELDKGVRPDVKEKGEG